MAADEVVQLYVSPATANQNIRPIQLQGFERVSLQPGETKDVQILLNTEQFGFYSNDGKRQWIVNPGEYFIKVGASSTDIRLEKSVNLKGNPLMMPIRNSYLSDSQNFKHILIY